MKKINILGIIFLILSVGINVFIMVESFVSGEPSAEQSTSVGVIIGNIINTVIPSKPIDVTNKDYLYFMRKLIGHFLLFGLSGILTTLGVMFSGIQNQNKKWIKYISIASFGIIWATLTEVAQSVTPGRVGSIEDVLIDSAGYLFWALLAVVIFELIYHRYKRKK